MADDLRKLQSLVNKAIDSILETCERRKEDFPRLDVPASPGDFFQGGIRTDPAVADAISIVVAAASQLIATLQPPKSFVTALGAKVIFLSTSKRLQGDCLRRFVVIGSCGC